MRQRIRRQPLACRAIKQAVAAPLNKPSRPCHSGYGQNPSSIGADAAAHAAAAFGMPRQQTSWRRAIKQAAPARKVLRQLSGGGKVKFEKKLAF